MEFWERKQIYWIYCKHSWFMNSPKWIVDCFLTGTEWDWKLYLKKKNLQQYGVKYYLYISQNSRISHRSDF